MKKHFENRLEGKNTGLDSLIRIDGYYSMKNLDSKDTTYRFNFIFFNDGTYAAQFHPYALPHKNCEYYDWDGYPVFGPYAFRVGEWGVYQISHDTIKSQILMLGACYVSSSGYDRRFKIIDKQTLKYVYTNSFEKTWSFNIKEYSLAGFVPLDTLPSSDFPYKEDKFFWRHESDWKAYMERINKVKIK